MEGEPYEKIVNASILQTMTRSINTLATVVVTLVALFALGGASLQNFAFALLVGICSGGYHSIFYSAPLVVRFQEQRRRRIARQRGLQVSDVSVSGDVPGDRPRTVAEARAAAARNADRDAILAARRERKAKAKAAASGRTTAPPRYRRRRSEPGAPAEAASSPVVVAEPEEAYAIDPLDAENAGLHEEQLALGHEEIRLSLDEPEGSSAPPGAVSEQSPPPGTSTTQSTSQER
jgi:hypothetical protein